MSEFGYVTFDEAAAREFYPRPIERPCRRIEVPENTITTILAEWGEEQQMLGTHYVLLGAEGNVKYGIDALEMDNPDQYTKVRTEEDTRGQIDVFVKVSPIDAYPAVKNGIVRTLVREGEFVETKNMARSGRDLVVRHFGTGVLQVIPIADARQHRNFGWLYQDTKPDLRVLAAV